MTLSFCWQVDKACQLKNFLKFHGVSRRLLVKLKYHGGKILVDGDLRPVTSNLNVGQVVTIVLPDEGSQDQIVAMTMPDPLDILYEDDHYLIINKLAGYTSLPSIYNPQGSIANMVKAYYQKQNYLNQVIHVVTRLDKNTSGAMLFAKHQYAHGMIDSVLTHQAMKKIYWAVTDKPLPNKYEGLIDLPIARVCDSLIKREVNEMGKRAMTAYRLIGEAGKAYLYEVRLHTGRTHQIRVHFSHLGSPLIGDDLYGGSVSRWIERQALHCNNLAFQDPITERKIHAVAALPRDFKLLLKEEGLYEIGK